MEAGQHRAARRHQVPGVDAVVMGLAAVLGVEMMTTISCYSIVPVTSPEASTVTSSVIPSFS